MYSYDLQNEGTIDLKDIKLLQVASISLKSLERMIPSAEKSHSIQKKSQIPELNMDQEDEQYRSWEEIYERKIKENSQNPFKGSIEQIFQIELWSNLTIELLGFTIYSVTPFLLLRLYQNITAQQIHSSENKTLILIIVVSRLFRILFSFYGEIKLKQLGLKMYRVTVYAVTKKTFKCSPLSNQSISVSQMTKMMHNDCFMIMNYPVKLGLFIDYSLNLAIATGIVFYVSGISGFLGLLFLFATLFIRFVVKQKVDDIQERLEKLSSARIKVTIETLGIMKYIKTNALESFYYNKLRNLRVQEVNQLKKKLFIEMIQISASFLKFLSVFVITKLLLVTNSPFNIEIIFTLCFCIGFTNIQVVINAKAYLEMIKTSANNIEKFMGQQDIDWSHLKVISDPKSPYSVQIQHGTFSWKHIQDPQVSQTSTNSHHLRNINVKIKKGELIGIVGSYGSGKSSFVNSMIGQMNKKGSPLVTINGTVAYVSQNPWIMNQTVRNNILFGSQYNQKRFIQAIKYASLDSDLLMFPHGDLTVIGQKGSTLSGGQKARVSFARALYSDADIFILDDLLSAVDAHVGAFQFSISIKEFLKSKTVLLITHSLYHVSHTDRILIFQNGEISQQGKYSDLKQSSMFREIEVSGLKKTSQYQHILNGKIDLKEATQIQMIQHHLDREIDAWQSFKVYLRRNSGLPFVILVTIYVLIAAGVSFISLINLSNWALSPVAMQDYYFYIQIIANVGQIGITILLGLALYLSRIYQTLHDDMIKSILFSPISFFQMVSSDKIITRLSNDLRINDQVITAEFNCSLILCSLLAVPFFSIFYVFIVTKTYSYLAIFTVYIGVSCYYFSRFYGFRNKIQNLEKNLVSSLNRMYSEVVDGLPVIRAFKKVDSVFSNFFKKMSSLASASTIRMIIDAKMMLCLIILTNILQLFKVTSLLYIQEPFQQFSILLIFNIFTLEDLAIKYNQNIMNFTPVLESLGKCQDLTRMQPQAGYVNYLKNNWVEGSSFKETSHSKQIFRNGEIIFQNYSFRYRPEQDDVLRNISFSIKSGQKIGIVGRTGSGKSTLMLGLLRIIEGSSGRILIDGKDINQLSLEQLRSNINIILQEHFMYNGTIKENLDPSGCHSDGKIITALKMCGIWQKFQQNEGLNTMISEGGDNLSSGEKQLVNIARSLINPKKIVLIDEATASIDIKTDELIQRVMKKVFADRTVLVIAHRINTVIDSDRILVLQRGKVVEFDKPQNLLKTQNSIFKRLKEQSGKSKEN